MKKDKISIFWFRRDLRLEDNSGLLEALRGTIPVLPIFIFDAEILDSLPIDDARVTFIHRNLIQMSAHLSDTQGASIAMFHGKVEDVFKNLIKEYRIETVYTNHDYEPYARARDSAIAQLLSENQIDFRTYKDQVIFEKGEIAKVDGTPYVVFTPYKNKWKQIFDPRKHLREYEASPTKGSFYKSSNLPLLSLKKIGFVASTIEVPSYSVDSSLIANYEDTRNFPALKNGTSRLGPHLRFGTVSIRQMVKMAIAEKNEVFWNELIWREFFMQILWHFPDTVHRAFKPKYDRISWRNNESEFEKWKTGQTGYPLVDAGMRELNATGYMHNRVRMLVASFLCKHLLIDWRWGEAYFAEKLLDYDLSANVGNWQWAAGSGVDAAPYFRIFNPTTQVDKFDKNKAYINKWVPELQEFGYPVKMVDHKWARERCLITYKNALG